MTYWLMIHVYLYVWSDSERLYRKVPTTVCSMRVSALGREQKLLIKMPLEQKSSFKMEIFLRWLLSFSGINTRMPTHQHTPPISTWPFDMHPPPLPAALSCTLPRVRSNVHPVTQQIAPESPPIPSCSPQNSSPQLPRFPASSHERHCRHIHCKSTARRAADGQSRQFCFTKASCRT